MNGTGTAWSISLPAAPWCKKRQGSKKSCSNLTTVVKYDSTYEYWRPNGRSPENSAGLVDQSGPTRGRDPRHPCVPEEIKAGNPDA